MNSYKKLMGNSIIFAIGNFGSKIITLILVPLYTFYLTSKEYGTVDLVTTTVSLILPIVSLNIFEATLRYSLDMKDDHKRVLSNTIYVTNWGALFSVCLFFIFQWLLGNMSLSLFMTTLLIVQMYRSVLSQFARGTGAVKVFALDGIVMTFITAVSNIVLLIFFNTGLTGYLLSLVIANIVSIAYLGFRLKVQNYYDRKLIDKKYIKDLFSYSIPMIPNSIMWWLINASNRYFILFFMSASANGLFAVSTKIPGVLNIFSTIFTQAWQLSAIEEYEKEKDKSFFSTVFNAYSTLMFLVTGMIVVVLKVLMTVLFADEFFESWETIPFLMLGVVFSSLASFLAANYLASKETKGVFKTSIYSGILSLILNVALIPLIGLKGAAIGNMISFFFMFIIRYFDTRKYVSLKINTVSFVLNIVLILVMVSVQFANFQLSIEFVILLMIFIIQIFVNIKFISSLLKLILTSVKKMRREK